MPFKSTAQKAWAFKNKMPWAKKWAKMTKGKLPKHVKKMKGKKKK